MLTVGSGESEAGQGGAIGGAGRRSGGGGLKGGRVVGKSDEIGGYPAERPVKASEVVATIFHSLGLDLETHLPGPQARPFPLVDYGTQAITELF